MGEETILNYRLIDMVNGITYIGKNTPQGNDYYLVLTEVTVHPTIKLYKPIQPDIKMIDNQIYADSIKSKHFEQVRLGNFLPQKSLKLENIVANDELKVTPKDLE